MNNISDLHIEAKEENITRIIEGKKTAPMTDYFV